MDSLCFTRDSQGCKKHQYGLSKLKIRESHNYVHDDLDWQAVCTADGDLCIYCQIDEAKVHHDALCIGCVLYGPNACEHNDTEEREDLAIEDEEEALRHKDEGEHLKGLKEFLRNKE